MTKFVAAISRLLSWWVATAIALSLVAFIAPQQMEILVYKLLLITCSVLVSYWADRALFRNAPDIDVTMPRDALSAARLLARAILALGVIVGLTLGI